MNLRTKEIPGYEGRYLIQEDGMVYSIKNQLFLKPHDSGVGYLQVSIYDAESKNSKHFKMHRLLAEAFIPNPNNKSQVNHKNGIKTDNRLENLEWVTCQENTSSAWNDGLCENVRKAVSSNAKNMGLKNRKFDLKQVELIKQMYDTGKYTQCELAKMFGVWQSTIGCIVNGKTYRTN